MASAVVAMSAATVLFIMVPFGSTKLFVALRASCQR
jgi:hypothetical protein